MTDSTHPLTEMTLLDSQGEVPRFKIILQLLEDGRFWSTRYVVNEISISRETYMAVIESIQVMKTPRFPGGPYR